MSNVVTAKVEFAVGAPAGTYAIKLLNDPPEGRFYRIQSLVGTGVVTPSTPAFEGILCALHDGEIEPALLDPATAAGTTIPLVAANGIMTANLNVYHSMGLRATGAGTTGFSTVSSQWPDGLIDTPNAQWLLMTIFNAAVKSALVHLGYSTMRMRIDEWAQLKHRGPVVDTVQSVV